MMVCLRRYVCRSWFGGVVACMPIFLVSAVVFVIFKISGSGSGSGLVFSNFRGRFRGRG